MFCTNCGKDVTGTTYDRRCVICGHVRCSSACHSALMDRDEKAKDEFVNKKSLED